MRVQGALGRRILLVVVGVVGATSFAAQGLVEAQRLGREVRPHPVAVATHFVIGTPGPPPLLETAPRSQTQLQPNPPPRPTAPTVAPPGHVAGRSAGGPVAPSAAQSARTTPPPVTPAPAASPPRVQRTSLAPQREVLDRRRRIVPFAAGFPPGSLVVVNRERALYHVGMDGRAVRYPVAVGTFTEEWTGREIVSDKKVNPSWHPVPEPGALTREPVQGGDPANPLGPRALYLGRTLWRIHGTPASSSIGQAVSNGCIRMLNEHVIELYDNVMLGTEVYAVERLDDPIPLRRGRKTIE